MTEITTPNAVPNSENNSGIIPEFKFEDITKDKSGRTLREHLCDYNTNEELYVDNCRKIFEDKLESKNVGGLYKARVIFTILHDGVSKYWDVFLNLIEISDVLKACEMLDAPRRFKQLQRKIEHDTKTTKFVSILKQHVYSMTDVLCLNPEYEFSLTSSIIEKIKRWTRTIPESKLEYMAMMFDTTFWKKLADLCHFNPKHDFTAEWFLRFCFGTKIDGDSVVSAYQRLNIETFHEIYEKYFSPDFTYEIIRTKIDLKQNLSNKQSYYQSNYRNSNQDHSDSEETSACKDRIREAVISKEGMKTVLWYWDELVTPRNIHSVVARLREVDDIALSYGKIADIISKTNDKELLSELITIATKKSLEFKLDSDCQSRVCPVAVLCDASSSMEIAIKTSSIITSLLTCATNATLDVFGSANKHIDNPPKNVEDGVKFGKEMKTQGSTCCASSIGYYYERKKVVNTFIIVTDEEENVGWHNLYFHQVYLKYIEEINPASLIFISFSDPNTDALMVRNLRKMMDPDLMATLVSVYKFDVKNPDMNRMDLVLRDLAKK